MKSETDARTSVTVLSPWDTKRRRRNSEMFHNRLLSPEDCGGSPTLTAPKESSRALGAPHPPTPLRGYLHTTHTAPLLVSSSLAAGERMHKKKEGVCSELPGPVSAQSGSIYSIQPPGPVASVRGNGISSSPSLLTPTSYSFFWPC